MLEYPHDEIVTGLCSEFGYSEQDARRLVTEVDNAESN